MSSNKITILDITGKKKGENRITALSLHDYSWARIVDKTDVDIVLVGDSVGTTLLGYETTLPVTMEDMVRHTSAVKRGISKAMLVADMPFMSYQISIESAIENAGRLLKEGGAEAVKLEGGEEMYDTIEALDEMGIPVMGHVGLTPQSVHKFGGYRVQGKKRLEAKDIIESAIAVEEAGAFAIVLEGIPMEVGKEITNRLSIPTIGIGAGPDCDGQILVIQDLLGLGGDFKPKFVKQYADLESIALEAIESYIDEVKKGVFPTEETSYKIEQGHLRSVT
ncbi:MAG: 3-methyl-2-oxobutanoate hydroxymethyltransferase [Nitrospinae bacterium]|nr:3-methyl-2-oxobutanoate hydroxymethyltransferase [Nitrospinota bacterium]